MCDFIGGLQPPIGGNGILADVTVRRHYGQLILECLTDQQTIERIVVNQRQRSSLKDMAIFEWKKRDVIVHHLLIHKNCDVRF